MMKPTHMLHLVASSRGGGATHVRDLVLGLAERGHQVSVAMPEDDGVVHGTDFATQNITFHTLTQPIPQIRNLAKRVDILHCHGARAAFWGRLATMFLGGKRPKIVYSIHGFMIPHYPPPRRWLLSWQEKGQSSQVDYYIAVSHAERASLRLARLGRDDNVVVVWYGIDYDLFETPAIPRETTRANLGIQPDKILLMMACRFFWPRDFPTLLKAFRLALNQIPTIRLLLVGDGPWRPQIEALLDELALRDAVSLPGQRTDIPDLLHAADIFVLTSAGGDGLPISILEAMAAAKPVIATHSDGIPEEVIDGETGFVPPLGDVTALAKAITQLARKPDLRHRLGQAGRQRVQSHFKRSQMVEKIEKVYRNLGLKE